jgi:hypothetical protein
MTHTSQSVLGSGLEGKADRDSSHGTFLHNLEKMFTTERLYVAARIMCLVHIDYLYMLVSPVRKAYITG